MGQRRKASLNAEGLVRSLDRHVSCKERTCKQEFSIYFLSSFEIEKKIENSKCCLNISFKLNIGSFLFQKAATILAHSFYYGKTMWHSPGKSLSGYQFILHEVHVIK